MDLTGYGLATLALVFFGLYMVPRKLTALRDLPFALTMSIAVVASAMLISLFMYGTPLRDAAPAGRWLAFTCGPLWYVGALAYTVSVTRMGLTLATPIKNTTAVLGTLVGLIVFAEWRETRPLPAIAGALLVVLSAVLISQTGERNGRRSHLTTTGLIAAIAAAIFFASYTAPFKMAQQAGLDAVTLIGTMGLGILLAAVIAFAVADGNWQRWLFASPADHAWAGLCGVFWVIASLCMAGSIQRIGLAVTWPFTNLNAIVTVACGILIFREISVRKYWGLLTLGLVVGVVGVGLLGVARL